MSRKQRGPNYSAISLCSFPQCLTQFCRATRLLYSGFPDVILQICTPRFCS